MFSGLPYLYDTYLHIFIIITIYVTWLRLFKNQKIIDLKKPSWPKFCNTIFLFLLKVESSGPVKQQINSVLP